MVALNTETCPVSATPPVSLDNRLSSVCLSTGFDASGDEPVEFLETISRLNRDTQTSHSGAPTMQDIECLRQAAWKYERQTAAPVATGQDLVEVLGKLGYV